MLACLLVSILSFMIVPSPPSLHVEVIRLAWRVIAKTNRKRVCLNWRNGAGEGGGGSLLGIYSEHTQSILRNLSGMFKTCSE